MACERFAGALKAHAAGADASPDLRAHLAQCGACREDLARERRLVDQIAADVVGALRVEPSVAFHARVRERIAADASARSWTWRPAWRFAAAAAVVVVAAGVTAVLIRGPADRTQPRTTAARAADATPPVAPAAAAAQEPPAPREVGARVVPPAVVRRVAMAPREPEVLVPPDQRIAIGRLMEMLRTGKIDERAFPKPGADASEALTVAPLVVEELKVPPVEAAPPGKPEKQ